MERTVFLLLKGAVFMIPCRATCPHYTEGCHKTCAKWKAYQENFQAQHRQKMLWLKAQNEASTTVLRQCLAMNSSRSYHY